MAVNKLTSDIFEEKVLKNEKPVLVDFYADWCGPCKMLAPVVEQISNESDAYDVYKLNVDDAPDLAARYGVMSIPTLIVFRGGEAAARHFPNRTNPLVSIQNFFDLPDLFNGLGAMIVRRFAVAVGIHDL